MVYVTQPLKVLSDLIWFCKCPTFSSVSFLLEPFLERESLDLFIFFRKMKKRLLCFFYSVMSARSRELLPHRNVENKQAREIQTYWDAS